jgi:adenine/guanine phosphoribosyltransferase-like PRPP-binding protein
MRTYLTLNKLANKLELAERALRTCTDMFDTIAFRGMSGAFLGPALALRLKKQMILCRKPDDDSHSFIETEGYRYCKSYVIVDDFVSTCNTINKIGAAVFKFVGAAASCIGVLEINYLLEGDVVKAEQGVGTCAIITHQEHMNNLLDNLRKGFLP